MAGGVILACKIAQSHRLRRLAHGVGIGGDHGEVGRQAAMRLIFSAGTVCRALQRS